MSKSRISILRHDSYKEYGNKHDVENMDKYHRRDVEWRSQTMPVSPRKNQNMLYDLIYVKAKAKKFDIYW